MAVGTSSWVSKQQGPMPGPMAARMSLGWLPYRAVILPTAWGAMPRLVPRQPECTAAMAFFTGSYSSTGRQSA